MLGSHLILALVLLTGSPPACPLSSPDSVTSFPAAGRLRFWTRIEFENDRSSGILTLCDDRDTVVLSSRRPLFGPGSVGLDSFAPRAWPSRVVVVTFSFARADGVTVQPIVITEVDGNVQEVFPTIAIDLHDALCLGPVSSRSEAQALVMRHLEGDYCELCWPKHFTAIPFSWVEGQLKAGEKIVTSKKHSNWSSALEELQLNCSVEVAQTTANPP